MSNHISWHVELQVKPGQLNDLRALTEQMVESTRTEPGALIYERYISDDHQIVHVFERYVDSNAAVAHLTAFGKMYGVPANLGDSLRTSAAGAFRTIAFGPVLESASNRDPAGDASTCGRLAPGSHESHLTTQAARAQQGDRGRPAQSA